MSARLDLPVESIKNALREIAWLKASRSRYSALLKEIAHTRKDVPIIAADFLPYEMHLRAMENEAKQQYAELSYEGIKVNKAIAQLRELNGVYTTSIVTRDMQALVQLRVQQGFSNQQIGWMIGCTPSTVTSLKKGTYRFSDMTLEQKRGNRGRSTHFKTPLYEPYTAS
jgi:hypothetical protein